MESKDDTEPGLLQGFLAGWVAAISSRSSTHTVRGYVNDNARTLGHLRHVLKLPDAESASDVPGAPTGSRGQGAVPERSWANLWSSADGVLISHLAPKNLAKSLDLAAAHLSLSSQQRAISALSSLCQHLQRYGELEGNPVKHPSIARPKTPLPAPHPVPSDSIAAVLDEIRKPDPRARNPWPARDLAVAAVLIGTGLRVSEVCTVTVGNVSVDSSYGVTMRVKGKGRKTRVVPVNTAVADTLDRYLKERHERLGPTVPGDALLVRSDGRAFTNYTLRYLVQRWYRRAGVPAVEQAPVHAWRASFATFAVADGAPVNVVQHLLGHANLSTTQRYLAVADSDVLHATQTHRSQKLLKP